jgi:hypothetical protein
MKERDHLLLGDKYLTENPSLGIQDTNNPYIGQQQKWIKDEKLPNVPNIRSEMCYVIYN